MIPKELAPNEAKIKNRSKYIKLNYRVADKMAKYNLFRPAFKAGNRLASKNYLINRASDLKSIQNEINGNEKRILNPAMVYRNQDIDSEIERRKKAKAWKDLRIKEKNKRVEDRLKYAKDYAHKMRDL